MLDCNGGLHLLPGTPLEMNFNLRGLRHAVNYGAEEIFERARCLQNRTTGGW